jgi:transcriptional regulator with XRE-family HTH domain
MADLGENLRTARRRTGLSQKQLAVAVGVSQAMVSQLERGEKSPSLDLFERIAYALGVSASYLLGDVPHSVSEEEALYLAQLRRLTPTARERLRRYGQELLEEEKQ